MSKLKNMAVFSAMLVGVMIYTSPAKSAVCFLPDDDGNCGGGDIEISDDSTSENQCADFNLSQNQRNSKQYDSDCYTCEPCTYNGRTTYKCALNSGATWYGGNLSVCCTNGEKYFSKQGQCCPTTGCACSGGRVWNPSTEQCECPNGIETTTGICCNDGEHADGAICCPEKKHNEGGTCVCDENYENDGTGCKPIDKCKGYDLVSEKDSNCYSCSVCPDDSTKYKCTENVNSNYQLINGVCSKKSSTYTITVTDTKILQSSDIYGVKKLNKRSITSTNSVVTVDVTTIGVETDWLRIVHCGAPYDCDHGHKRETEITIKNGSEWEEEKSARDGERYTLSQVFTSMYITINGKSFPAVDTNNATCISTSVKDTNGDIYNIVCKNIEENCSAYQSKPWVVNGPDNYQKCKNLGYNAPCGEHVTCGGVEYIECKETCPSDSGSGSSCTANSYTASITCSLKYTTNQICTAFDGCHDCPDPNRCGAGFFECVFDIPSCAFSHVTIMGSDNLGRIREITSQGIGKTTRTPNDKQIPGSGGNKCEFYESISSLGKVDAYSPAGNTWRCEYTKSIR